MEARLEVKHLFWLCLFAVSYLALAPLDNPKLHEDFGDKINHIVAFFVLYIVGYISLLSGYRLLIFLFLYGITIEIIQFFTPYRTFSLFDVLANTIGLMLGFFAVAFYKYTHSK